MLEEVIAKKIRIHLERNKIVNEAQFGFIPGKCTIRQLARVCYTIISNINKNKLTGILLLDIEKAFDTVCHKALIYKMELAKIPIEFIRIVNSYLLKREFLVVHDGYESDRRRIVAGGSVGLYTGSTTLSYLYK